MKKSLLYFAIGALLVVSFGAGGVFFTVQQKETNAAVGNYSTNASTYYNGITATSGESLLGQLHDLITTTHGTYTTYDDCKNPTYVYATDGNPNDANYDYEFYSQANIASTWGAGAQGTWNREHVWCQSLTIYNTKQLWGESGGGSDMHHIRPVESGLNSARSNSPFGIVTPHNSSTAKYYEDTNNINVAIGGYKTGDVFEPLDFVKGDVARIVMYLYTHYNTYSNIGGTTNGSGNSSYFGTLPITNIIYTSLGTEAAAWDLLIDWHTSDPVDAKETRRNEACAKYQGNRNPFIDNASYANAIWGDGTVNEVTLSVSPSTLSLSPSDTSTLTATMSDSSTPTINWSSDATGVATVNSSGLVTAIADGSATITASATVGGDTYTGTCAVTVSTTPSGELSYTIGLDTSGTGDSSTAYTTENFVSNAITSGTSYVSSCSATEKAYRGNTGVKLGTSSLIGYFTLALSTSGQVNATKIVVNAKNYSSDSTTISVNSSTAQALTASYADYTFTLNGSKLTSIDLRTVAGKRGYVTSITVFYSNVSSDIVTALSATPTSKSYSTSDTLQSSDFTVSVTKNGSAGTSADYTAKIGTGSGSGFSGSNITWGSTKPTAVNTTIQFKAKYPTTEGGSTYLTFDVSLTVSAPIISSIEITQSITKTSYLTTDSWDPTGLLVTATFSDSSTQNVTSSVSWSYNPTSPNSTSITSVTITATYSGETDSVSQNVTVSEETFSGTPIVISEAYGGGGNSGATYMQDFVELYNNTNSNIDLSDYRLFYASATGTFNTSTLLTGTILAKSYFLVQEAAGTGGTVNIPTADVVGSIAMSGTAFKLALTNSSTAPTSATDANVVDFLGAGTANDYEGSAAAPALSNSTSVARVITSGVAIDTDNNGSDFTAGEPTPLNAAVSVAGRIMAYAGGDLITAECATKYSTIKSQMILLSSGSLTYFQNSTALENARLRYVAWANANNDLNPYENTQGLHPTSFYDGDSFIIISLFFVAGSMVTIAYFLVKRKKKYSIK